SLRMPGGIGNRDRPARAVAKNRDLLQVEAVDDQFEQPEFGGQREIAPAPVRQAASVRIVADDSVITRKFFVKAANLWDFPLDIEMAEPGRCSYQRRAAADRGIRDPGAVGSGEEADLLFAAHDCFRP